jgi:DNA-binding transcriptional MerR regulator
VIKIKKGRYRMSQDLRRPERTFTIRNLCVEFKVTPRALRFYEDKGLLYPAREGMNRVYNHRDRARLQLILRGKRVGLSLSEIREILDLYDENDGGAAQMAKSLKKFRERISALEAQREDIDGAIEQLRGGCERMERQLSEIRPDLLPQADDYDQVLRARLDGTLGAAHTA